MKRLTLLLLSLTCVIFAQSQDLSLYQKKEFISGKDTLPYRLLLPEKYNPKNQYPLVFFLHGAGERGNDNDKQLVHGGKLFLTDSIRKNYPAIVVFPQCSKDSYWSNVEFKYDTSGKRIAFDFKTDSAPTRAMTLAMSLLEQLKKDFKLNSRKIYVGGLSMGGMGTFEIVRRKPNTFAAAFAICGGANPATAQEIAATPWWIFHGLKDDIVNPQYSIDIANALKAVGAEVKLTLYPDANHNSWDSTFAEPDLLPWLFGHKR